MKLLLVQVRYGIGDIILAGLPYIHALSKKFNSKISLLVKESSRSSDLFADDNHIDEIITLKNDMDGVKGIFKLRFMANEVFTEASLGKIDEN